MPRPALPDHAARGVDDAARRQPTHRRPPRIRTSSRAPVEHKGADPVDFVATPVDGAGTQLGVDIHREIMKMHETIEPRRCDMSMRVLAGPEAIEQANRMRSTIESGLDAQLAALEQAAGCLSD